jgi:hypothetical protein
LEKESETTGENPSNAALQSRFVKGAMKEKKKEKAKYFGCLGTSEFHPF